MNQALLIIDAQQELIDGSFVEKGVPEKDLLINNINTVINKAIDANALIIFIRDMDTAGGQGPGFQIHTDINLPVDFLLFDKKATNPFMTLRYCTL